MISRMTLALLLITFSLVTLRQEAQAEINSGVGVMGFQAWKEARIDEAKAQLDRLQGEAAATQTSATDRSPGEKTPLVKADLKSARTQESTRVQKSARGDQKLQQAQLNLEIAKELAVNDYFVLYLSQFKDRSAFIEAARKLTADEAADLMIAYQRQIAPGASEPELQVRQ